jgi:hypothetical protein
MEMNYLKIVFEFFPSTLGVLGNTLNYSFVYERLQNQAEELALAIANFTAWVKTVRPVIKFRTRLWRPPVSYYAKTQPRGFPLNQ